MEPMGMYPERWHVFEFPSDDQLKAMGGEREGMTIRLTTRHSEEFDIYTDAVDPCKSPYATSVKDYAAKVVAFYKRLGVRSAIWTAPEAERPKYLERHKTVEYLLEVGEDRVVAYVDELGWSDYLYGKQADFEFSKTPKTFGMTTILVAPPIKVEEVIAIRRYRRTNGPDSYELVNESRPGKPLP
jgi:hypothetical protein